MVQNLTQIGMDLQIYQASTMTRSLSTQIPNQYLPPECGENNHRCGILHFEHNAISYYILPSIRGFVTLSHHIGVTQEPQKSFTNITKECNPVRAFLTGPEGSYRIVIACMDLLTRPHGIIYYLQYYFSPNTEGRGVIRKNTELQIRSEPIYNPDTVSKVIYVRRQKRCAEHNNLYFIDDAYVLQYPPDAFDPEYILSSTALLNCVGYQNIEHYGNDNLFIRCFNNRTAVYDSCTGRFNYPSPDCVPYPCSGDTVVYRNGRQLSLNKCPHSNDTQRALFLPFDVLTYGTCIRAHDGAPTFIGIANDGTVFVTPFGNNNITIIRKGNNENLLEDSVSWDQPIFSENRQIFGVNDISREELLVVNVTADCTIVRHIEISNHFSPDLVALVARNGSYNCGCQKRAAPIHRSWLPFGIPAMLIGPLLILVVLGCIALVFVG